MGALALVGCGASLAGIITTPAGLAPGTQYQLAFVTSAGFFATSGDIGTYNSTVSSEAALNSALAAFDSANGVTWTIVGSTTAVNANVNAPSTGLVYGLDGTEIASGGLYTGSLLSPIDIDENGNTVTNSLVWTGSMSAGTAAGGINDLGQTFPVYGSTGLTNGGWIADSDGIESDNNIPFYALSSVITVPTPSNAPEPGTLALIPGALLGIWLTARRASRSSDRS